MPQELILRLYDQSVSGIGDDKLADEAGWALYARCESIISATNGFEKKCLICLSCGSEVPLLNDVFSCPCGFFATWGEFKKSFTGKQLYAANALPIFLAYRRNFPKAGTYGEKLICIDTLIHSFHIRYSDDKGLTNCVIENENIDVNRPTGANLIEGTLSEVILFLDGLSSIEGYSPGKEKWRNIAKRANGGEILK